MMEVNLPQLKEFNSKVQEIASKIDFDSNVIYAVQEFSSGHACWNAHTLTQYVKFIHNKQIWEAELKITGCNDYGSYFPAKAELTVKINRKEKERLTVKVDGREVEEMTGKFEDEELIETLWDPENTIHEAGWKQEYWQKDSVNYGSYKYVFRKEFREFITELENLAERTEPCGEEEVSVYIKVTKSNIDKVKKLLKENEDMYWGLNKLVNDEETEIDINKIQEGDNIVVYYSI